MGQLNNKRLGELPIKKDLQKIDEKDLSVLFDFNKMYPSTQAVKDSIWSAIEIAYISERRSL